MLEQAERTWTYPPYQTSQCLADDHVYDEASSTQERSSLAEEHLKARQEKARLKVNWLSDRTMLQKALPRARVMTFNYGREEQDDTFSIRIKAAENLLSALVTSRKDNHVTGVLFLATLFQITPILQECWAKIGVTLNRSEPLDLDPKVVRDVQSKTSGSPEDESPNTFNDSFIKVAKEQQYRLACFYESPKQTSANLHSTVSSHIPT